MRVAFVWSASASIHRRPVDASRKKWATHFHCFPIRPRRSFVDMMSCIPGRDQKERTLRDRPNFSSIPMALSDG